MDDWRQTFRQIAYKIFGQYPELYVSENIEFGDYYSNIALRCDKENAFSSAIRLKKDLLCLEEWVDIQVSIQGFLNFKLTTKAKLQLLQPWQKSKMDLNDLKEQPKHSSWHAWRLFHTQKCLAYFGASPEWVKYGRCQVIQNNVLLDILNVSDQETMSNLWLTVSEYKTHQDVQLEWIQSSHSVIVVYKRLHALFQQWEMQPQQIQNENILQMSHERKLLLLISQFSHLKSKVLETSQLDHWNKYLKLIAREMQYYYNVVVLNDGHLIECFARYMMLKAIHHVLKDGLAYLGWSPIRE